MSDQYRTTDKENRHADDNKEHLNPTPMQPPLGYKRPPTIVETIREQLRGLRAIEDQDPETEEEADDFEIDEDPILPSRWENDHIPSIKETRARLKELEREHDRLSRQLDGADAVPATPPHAPAIAGNDGGET